MELRVPDCELLPSYVEALKRGWSPSSSDPKVGLRELDQIGHDPDGFLAGLVDIEADGPPVELPDGSTVPRIPGYKKWMWDGEFCGGISFRWQPPEGGGFIEALPAHVLGHVGYGVVPWKRRKGYASQALRLLLPEAQRRGFRYIEVTCDADNIGSRAVIESAGGTLHERFTMPETHGAKPGLRFRIPLGGALAGEHGTI